MARIRWTPEAQNDFEQIAKYIGVQGDHPDAAEKLIDGIIEKCRLYADQPGLGSRHPELADSETDLRIFPYKGYVVIYKVLEDGIEVFRIVHGSRDFPRALGP